MSLADYLILALVAVALIAGLVFAHRRKKRGGGCCGGCTGCSCGCGTQKPFAPDDKTDCQLK